MSHWHPACSQFLVPLYILPQLGLVLGQEKFILFPIKVFLPGGGFDRELPAAMYLSWECPIPEVDTGIPSAWT
jgi:hypothetical protein